MKHVSFKQVRNSVFNSGRDLVKFVTPTSCFKGEFISIGNRNTITAVFFPSPLLEDGADFKTAFGVQHDIEKHYSIIQYNPVLGGYLYTWAEY